MELDRYWMGPSGAAHVGRFHRGWRCSVGRVRRRDIVGESARRPTGRSIRRNAALRNELNDVVSVEGVMLMIQIYMVVAWDCHVWSVLMNSK